MNRTISNYYYLYPPSSSKKKRENKYIFIRKSSQIHIVPANGLKVTP
jgi:hypothetical protein